MSSMDSDLLDIPIETLAGLLSSKDIHVKKKSLEYIFLLTGNVKGCKSLYDNSQILLEIIKETDFNNDLSKLALDSLINIASSEEGANAIFKVDLEEWKSKSTLQLLCHAGDRKFLFADRASNVLNNMTTWESLSLKVANCFISEDTHLHLVFEAVHNKNYNPECPTLSQHLCQLIGNLAQSQDFQKYLLTAQIGHLFCSILPLINIGETVLQRQGIISAVYNCLFDKGNHKIILDSPFNILSYLLYPLAGPEEFDEDEADKMPIELQYLGSDKEREKSPEVRKLILKSLLLLCDTKNGRTFLRDQQTYPILREYHKWEKDPSLILACENVVDILIRTEEEIGLESLTSIDVPNDLKEKFEKMDEEFIREAIS